MKFMMKMRPKMQMKHMFKKTLQMPGGEPMRKYFRVV